MNFCWVPSHVGIQGNENADHLAKAATTLPEPRRCPLPFKDTFPEIRSKIKNSWKSQWENILTNQKLRSITTSVTPWSYPVLPRRLETALCRLRIGHTRLTHDFLMTNGNQPFCNDCLVPLTVRHLLVECPSLGDLRYRFLSWGRGWDGHFILARIVGEECIFQLLFSFIKEAGLLNKI